MTTNSDGPTRRTGARARRGWRWSLATTLASVVMAATLPGPLSGLGASPAGASTIAPVILVAEVQPDQQTITVTWDATGDNPNQYQIYWRPAGTTSWQWSSTADVGADHGSWVPAVPGQPSYSRDFRALGITPGHAYEITVKSVMLASGCPCSDPETTKVPVSTLPPVSGVAITSTTPTTVTLHWSVYTPRPLVNFSLYLSVGSGNPAWFGTEPSLTATSHTFTGLDPNTTYSVGVRANETSTSVNGATVNWVRTAKVTATATTPLPPQCTGTDEAYCTVYPNAFVSTSTGRPVRLTGVNFKFAPFVNDPNGSTPTNWSTPTLLAEVGAMGASGAPAFNVVRMAMDMPEYWVKDPTTGVIGANSAAFAQLDSVIGALRAIGVNVILDPIHTRGLSGMCGVNSHYVGAHWDLPAWAWQAIGETPGNGCDRNFPTDTNPSPTEPNRYTFEMGRILALQQTADYLKFVLQHYAGSTDVGRSVVAVDLVNEPHADGNTAATYPLLAKQLIETVYTPWLASSGSKALRTTDPDKILIVDPGIGDGSLQGVDLTALQKPNVVVSLHDYYTGTLQTSATYGIGYSPTSGYATSTSHSWADEANAYDPSTKPYATRKAEHIANLDQRLGWLGAYQLSAYIGEYGTPNPCNSGPFAAQFAADAYAVYETRTASVGGTTVPIVLPRTWWSDGWWNGFELWNRNAGPCGSAPSHGWQPYAKALTGNAVR